MRKRNLPENKSTSHVKRERESIPWRYCLLTLFFGGLLVIGFFFAARQHFSAINYGMKNGELRKRRDVLEDENRRLTLAKEKELSMPELEKKAKEYGLVKLSTQANKIVEEAGESIEMVKNKAVKTFLPKSQESKTENREPKAEKTSSNEKKKDSEKTSDSNEDRDKSSDINNDKKSDIETKKEDKKTDKDSKSNKNFSKTGN